MAITVPVYGELASFGAGGTLVTFPRQHTYIRSNPRKRKITTSQVVGRTYGVDTLGGGNAPLASQSITFMYWLVGSNSADVQTAFDALEAQCRSANTDGSSGETATLTIYNADFTTTVSAPARFEDASPSENDRTPSSLSVSLIFTIYADFQ